MSGYDTNSCTPAWVSYRLVPEYISGSKEMKKRKTFYLDPQLDGLKQGDHFDYTNTGYDRGHCFPHADAKGRGLECEYQSYSMANVMPQLPSLNRKIWLRLEEDVRSWTTNYGELWVITGPVETNATNVIGHHDVFVPEACYKIIAKTNPSLDVIAFMMPQSATGGVSNFVTSVDHIESLTGLDFFSDLSSNLANTVESKTNTLW